MGGNHGFSILMNNSVLTARARTLLRIGSRSFLLNARGRGREREGGREGEREREREREKGRERESEREREAGKG